MLRQQLTLALAVLAISVAVTAEENPRIQAVEKAEAAMADSRVNSAEATRQAESLMMEGNSVGKEMRQVTSVEPAPLGSIDGIRPTSPDIDLDALMARYGAMRPTPALAGDREQLLVFISASVPKESLRSLARQAASVGAPLVLRGVVDGDFPATAEFMRDILGEPEKDGRPPATSSKKSQGQRKARALIDPTLFARFDVRQVPAMVLVPDGACVAGIRACPHATPAHVHVAGDVTLDYALDHIARTHPEAKSVADPLLARLGGTP
jgi:type-F conjugative transfer system pilin assembly protein TrbC